MKTKLLILFSFFSINTIFCQIRLNYTKDEIKEEFSHPNYMLDEFNFRSYEAISIVTDDANILYLINSNEVCKICILIPMTEVDLNKYVELYNNSYTKISDTEWKMYSDSGIANIELIFVNNGTGFRWTTN